MQVKGHINISCPRFMTFLKISITSSWENTDILLELFSPFSWWKWSLSFSFSFFLFVILRRGLHLSRQSPGVQAQAASGPWRGPSVSEGPAWAWQLSQGTCRRPEPLGAAEGGWAEGTRVPAMAARVHDPVTASQPSSENQIQYFRQKDNTSLTQRPLY